MEELNKSQIVLLTLLVSFVTSLATGIVTVSLMEQGITPVTNTVNQIVERTKEIIVKVPEPQDPIVITETVTVHQSDLIAAAVAKNKNSSIIVYEVTLNDAPTEEVAQNSNRAPEESIPIEEESGDTSTDQVASAISAIDNPVLDRLLFTSRALVLSGGVLVADAAPFTPEGEYVVLDTDGERVPVVLQGMGNGVVLFSSTVGTSASLGDTSLLQRGQAIIALSGVDRLKVITGIVSDIVIEDGAVSAIEIDKPIDTPGSILINMNGEVVGISTATSRAKGATWFAPGNVIETTLHVDNNTDS